jgi:GAF domain-containing protein
MQPLMPTNPEDGFKEPAVSGISDLLDEAIRILQVSTEMTTTLDPDAIPRKAVDGLHRVLQFPVVAIALVDPASGKLALAADRGLPESIRALGFRPGGTAHTVLASGAAIFVEDTAVDPRVHPEAREFRRAYAGLPIRHGDDAFGVLFVNFAEPHRFPEVERVILDLFAHQTAIALANARLNQRLRSALDQVKTLSGLIPICSYCKQVRTDQGFWQQVETFLFEHTDARFSHGICPSCVETVRKEVNALK